MFCCSDIAYWTNTSFAVVCGTSGCITIHNCCSLWPDRKTRWTQFERFIYPFTHAKPNPFPLSALDIHHKAPACHFSVQSGSVLFTTSFSHMLQATGGWWERIGCGDRQVSCLPQPPLSVKSADSTEAVTLVMEGLLGTRTCVQQPCGVRWTTGAFWPTILLYLASNVSVSLSV